MNYILSVYSFRSLFGFAALKKDVMKGRVERGTTNDPAPVGAASESLYLRQLYPEALPADITLAHKNDFLPVTLVSSAEQIGKSGATREDVLTAAVAALLPAMGEGRRRGAASAPNNSVKAPAAVAQLPFQHSIFSQEMHHQKMSHKESCMSPLEIEKQFLAPVLGEGRLFAFNKVRTKSRKPLGLLARSCGLFTEPVKDIDENNWALERFEGREGDGYLTAGEEVKKALDKVGKRQHGAVVKAKALFSASEKAAAETGTIASEGSSGEQLSLAELEQMLRQVVVEQDGGEDAPIDVAEKRNHADEVGGSGVSPPKKRAKTEESGLGDDLLMLLSQEDKKPANTEDEDEASEEEEQGGSEEDEEFDHQSDCESKLFDSMDEDCEDLSEEEEEDDEEDEEGDIAMQKAGESDAGEERGEAKADSEDDGRPQRSRRGLLAPEDNPKDVKRTDGKYNFSSAERWLEYAMRGGIVRKIEASVSFFVFASLGLGSCTPSWWENRSCAHRVETKGVLVVLYLSSTPFPIVVQILAA